MGQVNIQSLVGSMVASVSSIAVTVVVVILYATFLLIEKRSFDAKIAAISSDPRSIAWIRQVTSDPPPSIGCTTRPRAWAPHWPSTRCSRSPRCCSS
jgi:hypothetical protein